MKKLLIIKLGETFPNLSEQYGDFEDWIKALIGITPDQIDVAKPYRGEQLPKLQNLMGVVITGSHDMITDKKEWSERTAKWIPSVIDASIPLLGICYGHQLLAYALGGKVGFNPNGIEFGTTEVHLNDNASIDPIFRGLPSILKIQASHSQSVIELPPNADLIASNDIDPHHAFTIAGKAWGVQFHPEYNADIMKGYVQECADMLTENGQNIEGLIGNISDSPHSKSIMQKFGEIVKNDI